MSSELKTEICVVGAGPAGTTIACRLAELGYEVCLLEREAFPRGHVGESLAPGILPLFDVLEIREQIERAGFYRPLQAFVKWSGRNVQSRSFMGEPGLQVDRARFDHFLLKAAQSAGVRVVQPADAGKPQRIANEKWLIPVRSSQRQLKIIADFLVDAAGRRSILGGPKKSLSPRTLALYGYWYIENIGGTESRVESGVREWYWGAPLPDGTFNAVVFLDFERFRAEKINAGKLKDFYFSLLKRSSLLQSCLDGKLLSPVQVCDASAYLSEDIITKNSIKVGEAGFTIDQLSSQGVETAMRSGLQGSAVVHTLRSKPANTALALEFYRERTRESAFYHQAQSAQFYTQTGLERESDFWNRRKSPVFEPPLVASEFEKLNPGKRLLSSTDQFRFSPEAKMLLTPALTGDTIEGVLALTHHSLKRPAAFIAGVPADFLWNLLSAGRTLAEILGEGELYLPREKLLNIIGWMVNSNIFIPSNEV